VSASVGQVRIRQAGLQLLQDALEGSGGGGPTGAYVEAIRMIFKVGLNDKSAAVRTAAAGCLRAVALTGGPGVASGGLEACINLCLKVLAGLGAFISLARLPCQFDILFQGSICVLQAGTGGCLSRCSGWVCFCFRGFAGPRLKPAGTGKCLGNLVHMVAYDVFSFTCAYNCFL